MELIHSTCETNNQRFVYFVQLSVIFCGNGGDHGGERWVCILGAGNPATSALQSAPAVEKLPAPNFQSYHHIFPFSGYLGTYVLYIIIINVFKSLLSTRFFTEFGKVLNL